MSPCLAGLFTALALATAPATQPTANAADAAKAFVDKTNAELKVRYAQAEQAHWIAATFAVVV